MQVQWFLIQSKPSQKVKACQELEKQGYEVFLYTKIIKKIVAGKLIQKEDPIFSSYLFIQLNQTDSDLTSL